MYRHLLAVFAAAALLLSVGGAGAPAVQNTYFYDMETPMDWADVSMEWGLGGKVAYACEEPGLPGKALHMTTFYATNPEDPCANEGRGSSAANEGRAIQFNHQPGTTATISFDFRMLRLPTVFHGWIRGYYFDGYVTAEFFQENLDDPFYNLSANNILYWSAGGDMEWQHIEATTHVLQQPVLTIWFQAANPVSSLGYFDAAIDNLAVTVEVSEQYFDPGFDWGAGGQAVTYDKMLGCRRSDSCKWIQWCDMMYDEHGPHSPTVAEDIWYGSMNIFRDTSSRPLGGLNLKHDYWHRSQESQASGASVIGFASIHGEASAKSMGKRQTASYSAFGLAPGQPGHIVVHAKGTSTFGGADSLPSDPRNRTDGPGGRTLLGVDPYGGNHSHDPNVIWTQEATTAIEREGWAIHTIEFDRPLDSDAVTVFVKWRDGQANHNWPGDPLDCDDNGVAPGNNGWFDYAIVRVTPLPTATPGGCTSDIDGDGVCDEDESPNDALETGESSRTLEDSDSDGLLDGEEDTNGNGGQDAGETSTRNRDSDGDGFLDGLDAAPLVADAGYTDADGDRLDDASDPDPADADADNDGFKDGYEAALLGLAAVTDNGLVPPMGDINGDGAVSNLDALGVQSFFVGNIDETSAVFGAEYRGFRYTDANGDGFASNFDALALQSFFIGNLALLPVF